MALTISTQLITPDGFVLSNSYGRVAVIDNVEGKSLQCYAEIFKDAAAFESGASPINFAGIKLVKQVGYDRAAEGSDILALSHVVIKELLETQDIRAEIVL
tara:strand:+ start:774 stop:1076 length:303 start_codon:yes stop_codon:yes gene_type:complete